MNLVTITGNWLRRMRDKDAVVQYGAMPYRIRDGRIEFLLVTSRRTGRWIFPKGGLIEGLSPAKSAAQEALEEAGVEGIVEPKPIGTYRTVKQRTERTLIDVEVYPLKVERELDKWREMHQRRRHWVPLDEARQMLSDKHAASLAMLLSRRVLEAA